MIAAFRSFARFAVAWFFKNIQLIATDVEINVSRYEYRNSLRRYPHFRRKFKLIYHSRLPRMASNQGIKERKQKIILSVGHFAYRKGQHVLLKAFGRIAEAFPSWRLQLVGASNTGEYHSMLESIVDDLKVRDRVDFVTETHQPDEYFERASIYVQPSLVEAYGLALQEAMNFGCACIGSEAGGITDSISDRDYLFPPGNDEKLAHILRKLVASNELLNERMEHDFSEARRLKRDREWMLSEYRFLFKTLAARQRSG
jgi:GalNAc-alpha-(1->4)-GalNAc-alpha-(1->3)-diNAcBac-PP-undecaprenol alpha-1,4-N-acetyl-D-galactosaminyltransferase